MDLDFINHLSSDEEKELFARLSLRQRNAKRVDMTQEGEALWRAVETLLRLRPLQMTLDRFLEGYGRVKYLDGVATMEAILSEAVPKQERKDVRQRVRIIALECLRDYLHSAEIPCTAKTMLNNFDYLRHAIDVQFPGYIDAQLLHRVALATVA